MSAFGNMWKAYRVYRATNRIMKDAAVLFDAGHEYAAIEIAEILKRMTEEDLASAKARMMQERSGWMERT